jgi:hypothetical protein
VITVYYCAYSRSKQSLEYCHEPEPVHQDIFENFGLKQGDNLRKCPAFIDFFKNIFKIKSSYDYNLSWDGNDFTSGMYDQNFFNKNVLVRDIDNGIFSFLNPNIYFFADCDSLELETVTPIYEKKMIYDGIVIPGRYDCAKHFRRLECTIKLKTPHNIIINNYDTLYYVRFHTKEKIKLVRFQMTSELLELELSLINYRNYTTKIIPLTWYYNIVSKFYKKRYLKLIKQNLLE